jgi:nucleoside 2-deoxyribosyltransferase
MKRTVYLAGPIMDCTKKQANDWRIDFAQRLWSYDIRGVSPLRCEPIIGKRYTMEYADPKFGSARAIASKNMFDVRMCDMTLAFVPKPGDNGIHSLGTISELAWAHWEGKPTVLVTDDPFIAGHPVIGANAGWILNNFDDALEVIIGVLGGYTLGGKNV